MGAVFEVEVVVDGTADVDVTLVAMCCAFGLVEEQPATSATVSKAATLR
jgi:hypothetical protein